MMKLRFDHAVIAVPYLDEAIRDYQSLGFTVISGGVHGNRATHNALIVFRDGTYLELLAPTGEPPVPGVLDFSPMLWREGLTGFALRSDDLKEVVARLRLVSIYLGPISAGARRSPGGTSIEWKLALVNDGFAPFLIQDVTPRARRVPGHAAVVTHANGATGMPGLVIAARDLARARFNYGRLLGRSSFDNFWRQGIILRRAAGDSALAEELYAVQLFCDACSEDSFDLGRTHGVRFEFMTP
jgi:hypothetical protein